MPNDIIQNLMDKSGRSEIEIQKLWDKAKQISIEDKGKEDIIYIEGVVKNMLNLDESKDLYLEFLRSDLDIHKFIESKVKNEDAQASTSLGNVSDSQTGINKSKDLEISESSDLYKQGYNDQKNSTTDQKSLLNAEYRKGFEDASAGKSMAESKIKEAQIPVFDGKDGPIYNDGHFIVWFKRAGTGWISEGKQAGSVQGKKTIPVPEGIVEEYLDEGIIRGLVDFVRSNFKIYNESKIREEWKTYEPYLTKEELSTMSELEISKYANDLRQQRSRLSGKDRENIQKEIDLADSLRTSFNESKIREDIRLIFTPEIIFERIKKYLGYDFTESENLETEFDTYGVDASYKKYITNSDPNFILFVRREPVFSQYIVFYKNFANISFNAMGDTEETLLNDLNDIKQMLVISENRKKRFKRSEAVDGDINPETDIPYHINKSDSENEDAGEDVLDESTIIQNFGKILYVWKEEDDEFVVEDKKTLSTKSFDNEDDAVDYAYQKALELGYIQESKKK